MSDLKELYQEMILDHNRRPRNFRRLGHPSHHADGYNPLCGDRIRLELEIDAGGMIRDAGFEGSGCAISKASSSMMTECVKGKGRDELERLTTMFHKMVTGQLHTQVPEVLGKLAVFAGVCEFPSRVKCATLAWHTLRAALEGKNNGVTTEDDAAKSLTRDDAAKSLTRDDAAKSLTRDDAAKSPAGDEAGGLK